MYPMDNIDVNEKIEGIKYNIKYEEGKIKGE
jgi:hypothetical protein